MNLKRQLKNENVAFDLNFTGKIKLKSGKMGKKSKNHFIPTTQQISIHMNRYLNLSTSQL